MSAEIGTVSIPPNLPAEVRTWLSEAANALVGAYADDLEALILFGSAAEGRMRASSDVNLLIVLKRFDALQSDRVSARDLRDQSRARGGAHAGDCRCRGPLRRSAHAILELRGAPQDSPKVALEILAAELGPDHVDDLRNLSKARDELRLGAGTAAPLVLRLAGLAESLQRLAGALGE